MRVSVARDARCGESVNEVREEMLGLRVSLNHRCKVRPVNKIKHRGNEGKLTRRKRVTVEGISVLNSRVSRVSMAPPFPPLIDFSSGRYDIDSSFFKCERNVQ